MNRGHVLAPATAGPRVTAGTPLIVVEDVHVRYRVFADERSTLRKRVVQPWEPRRYREVHALKGVSFTVTAGEVVGVIGSNGSGKSTLMRVIAGLQPTDEGAVYARTTPMLLGVGAVLNRQLSGRRNILLGGLALGMSKSAILEREQAIIDFAGIGDAIDLPMRTYSSGMSARLQFAISAAMEPEILIVDEALAVGDKTFKRKSTRRIRELRAAAGTVFLVSHSVKSLVQTCTRVIWLDEGQIKADGDPRETLREYGRPERTRDRRRKRRKRRKKRLHRQRRVEQLLEEQAEAQARGEDAEGPGAEAPQALTAEDVSAAADITEADDGAGSSDGQTEDTAERVRSSP